MSHKSDLIATDIRAYLKNHEQKELLRFITCGSVDDGKSTLIGRLLHDSKLIYEDQLHAMKKGPITTNAEQLDLASIVDGLQAEREQGITIDVAYRFFSTDKRKFIIADTPGHEQYTRNMATGASTADLAIILIDAENGVMTQTKRHTYLVGLLGIRYLIVTINKMDLVDYAEDRFESIRRDYMDFLERLDYRFTSILFIPISALHGDNVVHRSNHMPWYNAEPLMECLEHINVSGKYNYSDFRLPIQYVLRPDSTFRGYCGTIASGVIRPGDRITVLPSRKESTVREIVSYDGNLDIAYPPLAVTLTLDDEIDISRGDMIVKTGNIPDVSDRFDAMVVWMHEDPITVGKLYDIKRATTQINGHIEEIYHKLNINSLEKESTDRLHLNEIGYCRLNLSSPIAYDIYADHRHTGGFIFIDRITNNTVGAGMIISRKEARNVVWYSHQVTKEHRVRIKGHRPCIIWLTGFSGSGKSTIASGIEKRLNQAGIHTFLLDGDNIRHGLCQDLGFSNHDRHENIRRVGEVAKLFIDAGLIVITSFISPFRSDRSMVRNLVETGEFIELFIDAPLEICEQRDPKGLYKRARSGEIKGFTGIDSPYEPPTQPEIHIKTDQLNIDESIEKAIRYFREQRILKI